MHGQRIIKLNLMRKKNMLFNFTKKYQFATRITLKDTIVEQVRHAKILGTVISDDLTWNKNCAAITIKCHMRMQLLRLVASFGTDTDIQKNRFIYKL